MAYRIAFTPRAQRDFKALDGSVRGRIARRIDSLAENPYPQGIKKIEDEDELYRMRVGDYRILYQVKGRVLLALIIGMGHRRDIYRRIGN
ncbi:MAG: type II toxin-antitoxin system RelE family toxin [Candidatus Binatia bacterium]